MLTLTQKNQKKADTKTLKINKKLNHKNTQNTWSLGNSPKILKIMKKLGTLDLPWKKAQKKNTKDLRKFSVQFYYVYT